MMHPTNKNVVYHTTFLLPHHMEHVCDDVISSCSELIVWNSQELLNTKAKS